MGSGLESLDVRNVPLALAHILNTIVSVANVSNHEALDHAVAVHEVKEAREVALQLLSVETERSRPSPVKSNCHLRLYMVECCFVLLTCFAIAVFEGILCYGLLNLVVLLLL